MDPCLPDVKKYFPDSDAIAEVTEKGCPLVRNVAVGREIKLKREILPEWSQRVN